VTSRAPYRSVIGQRALSRLAVGSRGGVRWAYQRVDALSRLATSAHAPQPAQLEERVRVVRGVAPDPGD
jgi:hypothetical protein